MSALTPAGTDPDALYEAFSSGREAVTQEEGVYLGRVEFSASDYLNPKQRKRVDKLGQFSIVGAKLSLEDAGIEVSDENRERIGALVGTGVGPMESMEAFAKPVVEDGAAGANPGVFPNTVYNAAGGQVAIKLSTLGPGSTVCVGHSSGAASLAYCYDLTRGDHADAMVSIAADTLTDTVVDAYRELGVLRGNGGGGLALAEAGVALVLERASKAEARGARVYGELRGYGIASDAKGLGKVDREGEGLERAMRIALERSGVDPGEIAAVLSSQTGLEVPDEAERKAIERVFGDGANVIAPKLTLGEPIGAGAAVSAALALKGWEKGGDAVPSGPVLINSLSLGGTNYALVLAPAGN
jgi:3-oxoacyl-[acyl-carrier-protein] synthase II